MILRSLSTVLLAGLLGTAHTASAQSATSSLSGSWRFTHALPAPWGAPLPHAANLKGQTLQLGDGLMRGPSPLDCRTPAQIEATTLPAEGLFQGMLPTPAPAAAQALGLSVFPVSGLSVSCDTGRFEFHQADADSLLLGLDNQIWTLSRAAGTHAATDSPAARVQALLELHFIPGPRVLNASTAKTKMPFQSRRLNRLIQAYLARPRSPDLVPPIDGDPYTDSQEYPTRFAVGATRISDGRAFVSVELADGWVRRVITYELIRAAGAWRVDDVDYGEGGRYSVFLQERGTP